HCGPVYAIIPIIAEFEIAELLNCLDIPKSKLKHYHYASRHS
ncbi:3579_t:CDS:1, partial [Racocetra persica]